jgi:hypothetical protein
VNGTAGGSVSGRSFGYGSSTATGCAIEQKRSVRGSTGVEEEGLDH